MAASVICSFYGYGYERDARTSIRDVRYNADVGKRYGAKGYEFFMDIRHKDFIGDKISGR